MEPTTDSLDDILKKLLASIPEVKAASIVSTEGLPIASALPQGVDETRISAMNAALLSLAKMLAIEIGHGKFEHLYVKGSDGYLLVLSAGPNTVLSVSTTKDVRLGSIFGNDRFPPLTPYPYIPPGPPGAGSVAVRKENPTKLEKSVEFEPYCKHCGAKLAEGQTICHVCRKKV